MNDVVEELAYVLSIEELLLLLAGKGVKGTELPMFEKEKKLDKTRLCYLMNQLYQKGMIDGDENQFKIEEKLDQLLELMKQAEKVCELQLQTDSYEEAGLEPGRKYYLYLAAEDCVVLEIDESRGGLISLHRDTFSHVQECFILKNQKKEPKNVINLKGEEII